MGEGGGGGENGVGGLKKLALNENVIPLRGESVSFLRWKRDKSKE